MAITFSAASNFLENPSIRTHSLYGIHY